MQPRDEAAAEVDGDLVPVNQMSHRQLEYVNSQPPSWLEFERQYQAHMRALAADAEFRSAHGEDL